MLTTRREFLRATAVAGGAAVLARPRFAWADEPIPVKIQTGTDVVTLGNTGIKTTVLGIGTGTRGGSEQRGLGEEGFLSLARHAYERGIRYIDTADAYHMHATVGKVLKQLPRNEIFLQTKTKAKTAQGAKDDIERFRKELGVDRIDTLLIHCMTVKDWPKEMRPVIDVLLDAKRKGWVRAIGVSCHSLDALRDAVDCPEMEVHLVRINPQKMMMDGSPADVAAEIKRMHAKNRGVIGMKIYGEGRMQTRDERLASLKYVLGLGTVNAFTIGFKSPAQIDETLELIKQAAG